MKDYLDIISPSEYTNAGERVNKYAIIYTAIHVVLRFTIAKSMLMSPNKHNKDT